MITVRKASIEDAYCILKIYDYYVKNTAVTFEYITPSIDEFKQRMKKIMNLYPYLVIEKDNAVQGYAYAGTFIDRAAYDWSCETTIYLRHNAQKQGMGRLLYEALENVLKKMGIVNLYACISYPEENDKYLTTNSADFHSHLGYIKAGEFHKCGYKFGKWYNMIWMEKIIGEHNDEQLPVVLNNKAYII